MHRDYSLTAKDSLFYSFKEITDVFAAIERDKSFQDRFNKVVESLIECYKNGGRIYFVGNGGSAADSQHLAAEFVSRLENDRRPLPAEALTADTSVLTALGNDYGFDEVFARQVDAKIHRNDVLIAISTSGNSRNIIRALKLCKERGSSRVLLTGASGGEASKHCEYILNVPSNRTTTIQELHIVLGHAVCRAVECSVIANS